MYGRRGGAEGFSGVVWVGCVLCGGGRWGHCGVYMCFGGVMRSREEPCVGGGHEVMGRAPAIQKDKCVGFLALFKKTCDQRPLNLAGAPVLLCSGQAIFGSKQGSPADSPAASKDSGKMR